MGSLTGTRPGTARGASLGLGALIGAIGAIAGAFGGYQACVERFELFTLRISQLPSPKIWSQSDWDCF
jgi:uncharacterized membrane protein